MTAVRASTEPHKYAIVVGEPDISYHARRMDSNSSIGALGVSFRQYTYEQQNPKVPTPTMNKGTAYHGLVLQPGESGTAAGMVVIPDAKLNTNAGKGALLDFFAKFDVEDPEVALHLFSSWKNPQKPMTFDQYLKLVNLLGGEPLLESDYQDVERMADATMSDACASRWIEACPQREISIYWEYDGMPLKSRIDMASNDWSICGDLKSCDNAGPEHGGFITQIWKMRYFRQCGFYDDALDTHGILRDGSEWILIAQQNREPYNVGVYKVPMIIRHAGRLEAQILLTKLYEYRMRPELANATHTHEGVIDVSLPKYGWAEIEKKMQKIEEQEEE